MRTRRVEGIGALPVTVGSLTFRNPVLTASGTAGHGAELAPYLDLAGLGAVVTKSVSADPWPGNPSPRPGDSWPKAPHPRHPPMPR